MGEFSQIMQIVAEQIKSVSPQMEVVNAFPNAPRNNPQKENLAVIGIQKVSLQPIGFEDFCGESFQVRGKKAEVWVKVSFCCKSAQQCWESWESVLNSMMFSKKLKVGQAECGETVWQKDWGGIVLPVRFCLDFIISGEKDQEETELYPEQFKIIRKGEKI